MSDGSLTVTSVSREDRGAYTCRAYSIQGEAVHTTHLLVQGRGLFSLFIHGALLEASREDIFLMAQPAQLGVGRGAVWGLSHVCHLPCLSPWSTGLMVWQGDGDQTEPFLISH